MPFKSQLQQETLDSDYEIVEEFEKKNTKKKRIAWKTKQKKQ